MDCPMWDRKRRSIFWNVRRQKNSTVWKAFLSVYRFSICGEIFMQRKIQNQNSQLAPGQTVILPLLCSTAAFFRLRSSSVGFWMMLVVGTWMQNQEDRLFGEEMLWSCFGRFVWVLAQQNSCCSILDLWEMNFLARQLGEPGGAPKEESYRFKCYARKQVNNHVLKLQSIN